MKASLCLSLVAVSLLAGCGDDHSAKPAASKNTAPSASPTPLSAPADYVSGLANAQNKAEKTVDTAALNQAIQMFNVQEGRFPKELKELVEKQMISRIPDPPRGMKFAYDPNAGSVKTVDAQ